MAHVIIGNDHGAVALKQRIVQHLEQRGFTVNNHGVDSEDSVDYPDIAREVCQEFKSAQTGAAPYDFVILCCGTGIGVSISANKVPGMRCAMPQNSFAARMAREHNNANAIAFGGRIEYAEPVEDMLDAFIDAQAEGGRHANRVRKIMALEADSRPE